MFPQGSENVNRLPPGYSCNSITIRPPASQASNLPERFPNVTLTWPTPTKIVITEACLASAIAGHVAIGHGKDRGVERIDERDRPMSRDADLLEEVKLPTRSGRQDP